MIVRVGGRGKGLTDPRSQARLERFLNAVHLETGYKPIAIYSPREVTTHGEDATDPGD
jgi:hypothetical protein